MSVLHPNVQFISINDTKAPAAAQMAFLRFALCGAQR
jgi:hypothetical protein